MLRNCTFLFLFLAASANAATLKSRSCEKTGETTATCRIELDGIVAEGDTLFLSHVNDADQLYSGEIKLGSTGYIAGRKYYARFLPRTYSLDPIRGAVSPVLTLETESLLGPGAGIPSIAKVKLISSGYPLYKIFAPVALRVLQLAFVLAVAFYLLSWLSARATDGWSYPRRELTWFYIGLSITLFLMTELPRAFVPSLISGEFFFFTQSVASAVVLWSLGILLLDSKFTNRSSIEKRIQHRPPPFVRESVHGAFLVALLLLANKSGGGFKSSQSLAMFVQAIALILAAPGVIKGTEWRSAWKRSSRVSLCFHFSLSLLTIALVIFSFRYFFFQRSNSPLMEIAAYLSLALAAWRVDRFKRATQMSRDFTEYCRERLSRLETGEERIQALSELIQEESNAARVSLISVQNGEGLVLASSGPDAIPAERRKEPRKLGPFLRRVCKEKHILYAPVAEELGRALIEQGLKHSSLAIPVTQGSEVKVVLCVMANEDERIPPFEAAVMELSANSLSLEILSAVSQTLSEEKADQLRSITKIASGLALEHMDNWGRLITPKGKERRIVVSADCVASTAISEQASRSPSLERLHTAFKTELYATWFALRQGFEFLSKDVRGDDFWAVSPKEFQNPSLNAIGAEKVALLLAHLLEKHARILSLRDEYRALGLVGSRVAVSSVDLRLVALGTLDSHCIDIDSPDMSRLQRVRAVAEPGEILVRVDGDGFSSTLREPKPLHFHGARRMQIGHKQMPGLSQFPEILSILSLTTDKKDLRRIEAIALETARESLARRKSA